VGDIFITEAFGDMNIRNVYSSGGDVSLKAAASILDAVDLVDPTDPASGEVGFTGRKQNADVLGDSITLEAVLGSIGAAGNELDIDSGSHANGVLTSTSAQNTYIVETTGDLFVNSILAGDAVNLTTGGYILDAHSDVAAPIVNVTSLATGDVTLNAGEGIGQVSNPFDVQIDTGKLDATSVDGIYINSPATLNLGSVASTTGDVEISVTGATASIVGAGTFDGVTPQVSGEDITLTSASGDIGGSVANPLGIDTAVASLGVLSASAGLNLYITETDGPLNVYLAEAKGGEHKIRVDGAGGVDDLNLPLAREITAKTDAFIDANNMSITGLIKVLDPDAHLDLDAAGLFTLNTGGTLDGQGANSLVDVRADEIIIDDGGAVLAGAVFAAFELALDYDAQTANFVQSNGSTWQAGDILTGGTSNATARIIADMDRGADGTLVIAMLNGTFQDNETITATAGGSATANGTASNVPTLTAAGADARLESTKELTIRGTVTTADRMDLISGPSSQDKSTEFQYLVGGHYLTGTTSYGLILNSGTLTTLGADSELELTSVDPVILIGNVDVLGAGSDLLIQSDDWVYQEGFISVQDQVRIYGGVAEDKTSLGGADPNGASVYVSDTSRVVTAQAVSGIEVLGDQDVDLLGVMLAGGSIGDTGVTWAGAGSTLEVTAGQQLYVATNLLASKTVQLNGGNAVGTDDRGLGLLVETAGGAISGGLGIVELDYDTQTANFVQSNGTSWEAGDILTGGTSGTTARIIADMDQGTTGTLTIAMLTGTFQDNETITATAGGSATANGMASSGTGGHIGLYSTSNLEMMGNLISGGNAPGGVVNWSGEYADVYVESAGQVFIGGNTTDQGGNAIVTGGYIQAHDRIEIVGGAPHNGDPGVFIHAASELTTDVADSSVIIRSASDADIQGLLLPGGAVVDVLDSGGDYVGRYTTNRGGASTLRIEAQGQIRVGTQLQAGASIDLVGGGDASATGLELLGSAQLSTWGDYSQINLNAPGQVDILAPAEEHEIEATSWVADDAGTLSGTTVLHLEVEHGDFTYVGSVPVTALTYTDLGDLMDKLQAALEAFTGYQITASTNLNYTVGTSFDDFADDPNTTMVTDPDIRVKLRDGRLVLASPYKIKLKGTSVDAGLLGFASGDQTSSSYWNIDASTNGSSVSIGALNGPNDKLYIGGRVLAHDRIDLYSAQTTNGLGIYLDATGVLQTVAGSIAFNAGDNGSILGDVLAGGSGSDIEIHSGDTLTLAGLLEADGDVIVTAGTTIVANETSIDVLGTSVMRSTGGGGEIQIVGLNDVLIDSQIGPNSTGLNLIQIESTEGTLFVDSQSGRIETDGHIDLDGKDVVVEGVVKNTLDAAATHDIDIEAEESLTLGGTIGNPLYMSAAGSIRLEAGTALEAYNATVQTLEAGQTITVDSQGTLGLGKDDNGQQLAALLQATGSIDVDATGLATINAAAKLATSDDDSMISVTAGNLDLIGGIYAGSDSTSGYEGWVGNSAGVQIQVTEMFTVGELGPTPTYGGTIRATGAIDIDVTGGTAAVGLTMNALSDIWSDPTGLYDSGSMTLPLPTPSVSASVDIDVDNDAQIYGVVRASDSGLGPDNLAVTAGGLLLIDGFIEADDSVTVSGGQ
ncbi:MAG: hypothetical protein GY713_09705, partial [Actinomycetia bacterium]|nr:hypothetical protein [Actinomycetes bacterium]